MPSKELTTDTGELARILADDPVKMYKAAYGNGMNLSTFLETQSPSDKGSPLDAFERLLAHNEIRTKTNWGAGLFASHASDLVDKPGGRALLHEFAARIWRRMRDPQQRAIYLSTDGQPGSWQTPYAEAQAARWDEIIAPAIPLATVVAMTTPIIGEDYRAFYLTNAAANTRTYRVEQGADLPLATLESAENTIQIHKYGRGLRATYEQLRRMRVDKLALHIARIAVQAEVDKLAAAIDVMVNGDGNSNTAASNHDLTVLDTAASAGTLTLKGWLAYKLKFANPYIMNVALMQEAVALQVQLLQMGSANVPLISIANNGFVGGLTPINQFADNVAFGWTVDAPTLKIVGLDTRQSLDLVIEVGSDIVEVERFVQNQTEELYLSEVMGFAILDQNAAITLDVNA